MSAAFTTPDDMPAAGSSARYPAGTEYPQSLTSESGRILYLTNTINKIIYSIQYYCCSKIP